MGYGPDLAAVHDRDFAAVAHGAARTLVAALHRRRHHEGLVVDLGCGSGTFAADVVAAGFDVLGVDVSEPMVRLAKAAVPYARFVCGSLFDFPIPRCAAVTAIGEAVNYAFDPRSGIEELGLLIGRAYDALVPNGVFLFDAAGPGRVGRRGRRNQSVVFHDGPDWSLAMVATEDGHTLTRDITLFRRTSAAEETYRKASERHVLRLYERHDVLRILTAAGFEARTITRYDDVRLRRGWNGFLAVKPS